MSFDEWIAGVACASALWGAVVTFWSPTSLRTKLLFLIPFVLLAVTGLLLVRAQSKQRAEAEKANLDAQRHLQGSVDQSQKEIGNIKTGLAEIRDLFSRPNPDKDKITDAINKLIGQQQVVPSDRRANLRFIDATVYTRGEPLRIAYAQVNMMNTGGLRVLPSTIVLAGIYVKPVLGLVEESQLFEKLSPAFVNLNNALDPGPPGWTFKLQTDLTPEQWQALERDQQVIYVVTRTSFKDEAGIQTRESCKYYKFPDLRRATLCHGHNQ